ncbi:MAG: hypothetical protein EXR71_15680 [Myxococcales bacterium]|nr:hypothetical protein [Myxococcales bacterium]
MVTTLFLLVSLVGCADPYGDAKKLDTIDAYEAFLAGSPGGADKLMAESRLEALVVKRATESHAIADYDAALKRFPSSRKKKDLQTGRANAAFAVAEADGSTEAWKAFLADNPFADGPLKKRAKAMVDVARFSATVTLSEPVVEPVNLGGDPKGAMDGWGIRTNVTNNSEMALEYANIELQFLASDGAKLKAVSWPVAAQAGPGGMPLDEATTKPLAPAETRPWVYTSGQFPEGWLEAKKVKVLLIAAKAVPAMPAP